MAIQGVGGADLSAVTVAASKSWDSDRVLAEVGEHPIRGGSNGAVRPSKEQATVTRSGGASQELRAAPEQKGG